VIRALALSIGQLTDPRIARIVWISIAGALLLSVLLVLAASWGLAALELTGNGWLDAAIDLLGGAASVLIAWALYPSVATMLAGFFLEDVTRAVEQRHYPALPEPNPQTLISGIASGLRLALLAIAINLIALPIYLLAPPISPIVFYALNGYLLGREYFDQIASRRLDRRQRQTIWLRYRGRLWSAGLLIAVIATIPLVNLIAPVIATEFMTHIFQDLRRREPRA
jgi:CysZ protein